MELRRFNSGGIQTFREALAVCREDANADVPEGLLTNNDLTEIVSPTVEIEPRSFDTKFDAATYLHKVLAPIPKQTLIDDAGLWTWLSLFYFDSVCPKASGHRKIRNDYTYIFEPRNQRNFYRQLLFISWRIMDVAPSHNRLLLRSNVAVLDTITTEVMKRLLFTRIPCFFEVIDRLYWDPKLDGPRRGARTRTQAGNLVTRLPNIIKQLERTYDLQSLTADQLIELLGDEFRMGEDVEIQMELALPET